MRRRRGAVCAIVALCLTGLTTGTGWGQNGNGKGNGSKPTRDEVYVKKFKKIAPAAQKAAAQAAAARGLLPGIAGLTAAGVSAPHGPGPMAVHRVTRMAAGAATVPAAPDPGGVPHYYGPYGNWAFSPLPSGSIATASVVAGGTGYTAPVVSVVDAYVTTYTPATVTATVTAGVITGLTVVNGGPSRHHC